MPMPFSNILHKDKGDIKGFERFFPGMVIKGTMEKMDDVNLTTIDTLSVKTTKVGKNTIKRMPNLKTVIKRAHGIDGIDINALQSKGIGLIATHPTTNECANWIVDKLNKIKEKKKIVFLGGGLIVKKILSNKKIIGFVKNSKNNYTREILKNANTLVVAIPLNDNTRNMIGAEYLFRFKRNMNIISISRGEVFKSADLIRIRDKKLLQCHFDIITKSFREEMLQAGFNYYGHQAWNFGFSQTAYVRNLFKLLRNYNEGNKIKKDRLILEIRK
jgi:lactate dehydrogenase-like 2-hydroxyacid dehydrogenase